MIMKRKYMLLVPLFTFSLLFFTLKTHSKFYYTLEGKTQSDDSGTTKYGALAIDRGNGIYYGWSSDCISLAEAEKKALDVCREKGGNCTIVLSFSGTGCAAYRFITGNVGMGYGWGLAKTKEEADVKAKKECAERSFGLPAPNVVFKCNSKGSGELKEIYDAHDEINAIQPGIITDY
ncbi:DUF4189 domain-containing protein [Mariniphaga sediminis]|uniref:DUF4189 domain-containing protein n=2 Tax=Mariniphaga sediminis TaxID=1628158 RepID=A0A399D4V6_9BACT|nr:DUF4189 domain-containing protein [Mariniphaga sediminis]